MSELIVLMYHALYADQDQFQAIEPEDRPYAVSLAQFRNHLAALVNAAAPVVGLNDAVPFERGARRRILISFDDGHASNHCLALPELVRLNMKAVFFVTSDFIGRRGGFCSMQQVRELSEAGMTVASHGKTHRFFDTLSEAEARIEFHDSKQQLEAATGRPVTAISFPGGRYRRLSMRIGESEGFKLFFGSTPGFNSRPLSVTASPIHRFAVRAATDQSTVARLVAGDRALKVRLAVAAGAKRWARQLLGSRGYHWAYRYWSNQR
jgi:peptidoglycan/xylan/chitin deacetylase (PgdA/CDA1 family)